MNKPKLELFKHRIMQHVEDPQTIPVAAYGIGGVGKMVHFYNPKTKLNVMKDMDGNFVDIWRLDVIQQNYLKRTGKLS